MPDDPQKQLDELLRNYARERRKRADIQLDPATRNVLRDEVQRVYSTSPKSKPRWAALFRRFLPPLAFAGALGAVAVIAILTLRQAENPKPASEIVSRQLDETLPSEANRAASAKDQSKPLMQQAAPEQKAKVAAQEAENLKREEGVRSELAAAAPAVSPAQPAAAPRAASALKPALTADKLALAGQLTNLGAARRTSFSRVADSAVASAIGGGAGNKVLDSFQIEQLANQLRIVDRDGSVYIGTISEAAVNTNTANIVATAAQSKSSGAVALRGIAARATVPSPSAPITPPNSSASLFSARGTNLTTGKLVVISGTLFDRTNSLPAAENTFSFTERNARPAPGTSIARARRSIIGTAAIGTNQTVIRAVSNEK